MAMMVATTAGAKCANEVVDDDDTGRRKQRMIKYVCEHAKRCIQQDYLGPFPFSTITNSNGFFIFHKACMIVLRMELKVMNFTMLVTMISLAVLQSAWMQKC